LAARHGTGALDTALDVLEAFKADCRDGGPILLAEFGRKSSRPGLLAWS